MSYDDLIAEIGMGHPCQRFNEAWSRMEMALNQHYVKTLTREEAAIAWLVVMRVRPKLFVELGGQHGHSGIIFSEAMKNVGGRFISVELGISPENKYPPEVCGTLKFLPEEGHVTKIFGNAEVELPRILENNKVDMVFHDCAHTWDHVEFCLNAAERSNPDVVQMCHDCASFMWHPDRETQYGVICAERPVFDKHFLNNDGYMYRVYEGKYGFGFAIPKTRLMHACDAKKD